MNKLLTSIVLMSIPFALSANSYSLQISKTINEVQLPCCQIKTNPILSQLDSIVKDSKNASALYIIEIPQALANPDDEYFESDIKSGKTASISFIHKLEIPANIDKSSKLYKAYQKAIENSPIKEYGRKIYFSLKKSDSNIVEFIVLENSTDVNFSVEKNIFSADKVSINTSTKETSISKKIKLTKEPKYLLIVEVENLEIPNSENTLAKLKGEKRKLCHFKYRIVKISK